MADPAGKERRQQMGPGESPAHLENCTGKKLISAKKSESKSRKIPVRSEELEDGRNTNQENLQLLLNSLRKVTVGELARSSE